MNATARTTPAAATKHRTVEVDGLDIFYREAGDPADPTLLLLHGFPSSSQMFRNLIPKLSDRFHLVAPDYPGFGQSSFPARDDSTTPSSGSTR
jgi:pimeloyl-ACP methyl ester carboxylesterase